MEEPKPFDLKGLRFLVVEDEFMVGNSLCRELESSGATVVGFCPDVETSMTCIAESGGIDVAIVDLNLGGVSSAPVVDMLLDRGVPTILCTGYESWSVEERFRSLPRCEKPFTRAAIHRQLRALPSLGSET